MPTFLPCFNRNISLNVVFLQNFPNCFFCFLRADSGEERIVGLEMELKVVGENMKQMEV
jgi:hypothetical protein